MHPWLQMKFAFFLSDSSLLLTTERRFAPTTVRYRRMSVRYESEQVFAFIGIRIVTTGLGAHEMQHYL